MAGESVVGALRVVLGMDTAAFEDGTKRASKGLDSFGKQMAAVAGGLQISNLIDRTAAALFNLTQGIINAADNMGKAAQKFGIPVEQLSALKYAADLSDVSLETLGKSLTILAKNMQTVAGGAANVTAAAFANMGISVKDANGRLKTSEELFLDVADSFSKMNDGATKTALAVAVFGRAGAELIPLLNQGREGIKGMTDEAQRMGIVITAETAKAAENFNDNLKRLVYVQQGVIVQILGSGGLLPALERLSFRMVDAANDAQQWASVSDSLARALEGVSTWVLILGKSLDTLTLPFRALFDAFGKIAAGDFAGAWRTLADNVGRVVPNLRDIYTLITQGQPDVEIWASTLSAVNQSLAAIAQIRIEPSPFSEKQFELGQKFNETLAKMKLEARELRGDFDALAPGFVQGIQQFKDLAGAGGQFGTTLESLTPKQRAFNEALQLVAQAKLSQEFLTPWQEYENQIARLNAIFPEAQRNTELYGQKSMQIALTLAQAWGQTAQSIVSPMADAFKTLATLNKKFAGAAKALAIAEALINTYLAATKALASGVPPYNYIAAAAVTAAGLANVAKISAQQFAQGGSFRVGGTGGIDSQMISFRATPGEMVDVRTPGQQQAAASTVNITMPASGSLAISDVRELVNTINGAIRDGYRINLAPA